MRRRFRSLSPAVAVAPGPDGPRRPPSLAAPLALPWWAAIETRANRRQTAAVRAGRLAGDVLLVGDSLVTGWLHPGKGRAMYRRYLAGLGALVYGGAGQSSCHLIQRVAEGEFLGLDPAAVVLCVGANHVGPWSRYDDDDAAGGVLAAAAAIAGALPRARLLVHAVPPRIDAAASACIERVNARVRDALPACASFVDFPWVFRRGGVPDPACYGRDGLHIGPSGYRRWGIALAGHLLPVVRDVGGTRVGLPGLSRRELLAMALWRRIGP